MSNNQDRFTLLADAKILGRECGEILFPWRIAWFGI
jgi:hypothetical protein